MKWPEYGKNTYSSTHFHGLLRAKYGLCTGRVCGTYPVRTKYVFCTYLGVFPKILKNPPNPFKKHSTSGEITTNSPKPFVLYLRSLKTRIKLSWNQIYIYIYTQNIQSPLRCRVSKGTSLHVWEFCGMMPLYQIMVWNGFYSFMFLPPPHPQHPAFKIQQKEKHHRSNLSCRSKLTQTFSCKRTVEM